MIRRTYKPGEWVIYRKYKHSTSPGPRARDIHPEPKGEGYTYEVDKFWVVVETREDDKVLLKTRRGKVQVIDCDDPLLRRVKWWERLLYRNRFPRFEADEPIPQHGAMSH